MKPRRRYRTVKLVEATLRHRGGWLEKLDGEMPLYVPHLPGGAGTGSDAMQRRELVQWANREL